MNYNIKKNRRLFYLFVPRQLVPSIHISVIRVALEENGIKKGWEEKNETNRIRTKLKKRKKEKRKKEKKKKRKSRKKKKKGNYIKEYT